MNEYVQIQILKNYIFANQEQKIHGKPVELIYKGGGEDFLPIKKLMSCVRFVQPTVTSHLLIIFIEI